MVFVVLTAILFTMFSKIVWCNRHCARSCFAFNKTNKSFSQSSQTQQQRDCSNEEILVDKDESITLIGINRPRHRNSITVQTVNKLCNAVSAFEADDSSPVAVLYGVGGTFSAGHDIKELETLSEKANTDFLLRHEGTVGPTRRHLKKPIICGINGFCIASGLELALMCDLRVMEDTAVLGFFNRQLGVPMSDGGTVRLPAIVGYARALDIILSGRGITAKEALHMGLVNRVVATGTSLGQAVNLAFCIAKFSQVPLAKDRDSVYTNGYGRKGLRNAIQAEVMNFSKEVLAEMKSGVQLFKKSDSEIFSMRQKTIPDWEKCEIAFEEMLKAKE